MKHYCFLVTLALVSLTLFAGTTIIAQESRHWHNANLSGVYAYQLTGIIDFPEEPLAMLNGPFAANGRIEFDGNGYARLQNINNFNGQISQSEIDATYAVNPDGTYEITLYVDLNGIPATATYTGVIADKGKQARFIQSGFTMEGISLPPGYIGMVVTGSLIRQ